MARSQHAVVNGKRQGKKFGNVEWIRCFLKLTENSILSKL
jgi:hypothetical protein